jgi:ketosteroid isomerase-like protein
MTSKTVERELLELEKQYWLAIRDRDVEAAMRLTDDPCIVAGARGVAAIDRKGFMSMMNAADYTLDDFTLSDEAQVHLLRDDVAVLAYKVHEELTVDGKPLALDAADTSTWVRREGRWLCALHTEAIAGDPFGRDRVSARGRGRGRALSHA